jgi:hypothetical protein
MITERTLVIIEHFHKQPLPERAGCLGFVKRYRYGDTLLSVYRSTGIPARPALVKN